MKDEIMDEMEKRMKDVSTDLTNGRKKDGEGADAAKTIKQIQAKIKIYEVSREKSDLEKVNGLFSQVENELKTVWTSSADKAVEKIEYYLEINEMDNVDFYYKQLKEIYPKVEKGEKKRIYDKILELRGKILKNKKKGD